MSTEKLFKVFYYLEDNFNKDKLLFNTDFSFSNEEFIK